MNRLHLSTLKLAPVCLAGFLLASPTWSDENPSGSRETGALMERLRKVFDRDGDGKLNDEERAVARRAAEQFLGSLKEQGGHSAENRAELSAVLKRFDTDGDGKLSDQEKAAALKGREGQMKKGPPGGFDLSNPPEFVIKRFDKDGDGKLNDGERAEARRATEQMMAKGKGGDPRQNIEAMMKRFDKDGDGKLSDEERASAKEAFARLPGGPMGPPPSREEMLKRFDKDGDGRLNDEEQAAARTEMEKRRGGGGGGGAGLTPGVGKSPEPKLDGGELLKKFDKDGDGKLSEDEKAAAREAFQNRDPKN